MRTGDGQLDRLLLRLQAMPAGDRAAVIELLSPAERAHLDRLLQPELDPEDRLSPPFGELVERLRGGAAVPAMTAAGRGALLAAAKAGGGAEALTVGDGDGLRPTLVARAARALMPGRA